MKPEKSPTRCWTTKGHNMDCCCSMTFQNPLVYKRLFAPPSSASAEPTDGGHEELDTLRREEWGWQLRPETSKRTFFLRPQIIGTTSHISLDTRKPHQLCIKGSEHPHQPCTMHQWNHNFSGP